MNGYSSSDYDASITLDFCKSRRGMRMDEAQAFIAFASFIHSLSKRCTRSRTFWRRYKKLLPHSETHEIRIDPPGRRRYVHVLIRKPAHLSHDDFEEVVIETAKGNPYIINGKYDARGVK